ncbi:glycosyltransferase [Candidatus Saccharibacteria bacterium]|nr:glycosyltransferase [Candidatus Saccharibacteria bacterium]
MKIAVFTDVLLGVPGGIPSSIMAQKRSLEEFGHEVVVFAPGLPSSLKKVPRAERKNIVLVPTHGLIRPNGAPLSKRPGLVEKSVLAQYPKFNFDVVHVHYEASCSIAGMELARRFNRPLIQTMHGREDMAVQINIPFGLKTLVATVLCFLHGRYIPHGQKIKYNSLAPNLARRKMWEVMVNHANYADKVITPSEHFRKKLVKMGVEKPSFVVSNGVDDAMIAELEQRVRRSGGSLVRQFKEGDKLRIFWNSRLSKEKRIMQFMETLSLMHEPFHCTFVGDGNALKSAERFARKRGWLEKGRRQEVVFYGRVPHEEVLDKMINQHLSVTVSHGFDTQGLTLLEAEATGLPVFFCDQDMREITPKGGAVIAKDCTSVQMARALDSTARNPKVIEKMSKVMLVHRYEVFQSAQIKKLLAVYE